MLGESAPGRDPLGQESVVAAVAAVAAGDELVDYLSVQLAAAGWQRDRMGWVARLVGVDRQAAQQRQQQGDPGQLGDRRVGSECGEHLAGVVGVGAPGVHEPLDVAARFVVEGDQLHMGGGSRQRHLRVQQRCGSGGHHHTHPVANGVRGQPAAQHGEAVTSGGVDFVEGVQQQHHLTGEGPPVQLCAHRGIVDLWLVLGERVQQPLDELPARRAAVQPLGESVESQPHRQRESLPFACGDRVLGAHSQGAGVAAQQPALAVARFPQHHQPGVVDVAGDIVPVRQPPRRCVLARARRPVPAGGAEAGMVAGSGAHLHAAVQPREAARIQPAQEQRQCVGPLDHPCQIPVEQLANLERGRRPQPRVVRQVAREARQRRVRRPRLVAQLVGYRAGQPRQQLIDGRRSAGKLHVDEGAGIVGDGPPVAVAFLVAFEHRVHERRDRLPVLQRLHQRLRKLLRHRAVRSGFMPRDDDCAQQRCGHRRHQHLTECLLLR